jgi:glycine hydroxymethyltransferase
MKKSNKEILDLIKKEELHESETINLIPSENLMSHLASSMYSYRISNKYILPIELKNKVYMPGREYLEKIIKKLENKISSIYGVKYATIKGLSGLHQMEIIFMTFSDEFKKCLILNPFDGGHMSTEQIAKKYNYSVDYLNLNYHDWDIDLDKLNKLIKKFHNEKVLVYIDHTIVLKPINIEKILSRIPKNWIVYYDISHLQLFYFMKMFKFPKDDRFFFGGSTHKSFPGPQKAILLSDSKELFEKIKITMNNCVSSYHTGSVLAIFITLNEMNEYGRKYAKQIIKNSQYLAKLLSLKLKVVGPKNKFTFTHQICVAVSDVNDFTKKLASLGLITTPMRVPSTNQLGLRLGIQEITRLGMKKEEMEKISQIIINAISGDKFKESKNMVKSMARKFYKINYSFRKDEY